MPSDLDPTDRLVDTPTAALGQRVPEVLHRRLDQLCNLAYDAGLPSPPSKKEMVGAILFASPESGQELRDLLDAYGKAKVRDALVGGATGQVVQLPARRSGPRSGRR